MVLVRSSGVSVSSRLDARACRPSDRRPRATTPSEDFGVPTAVNIDGRLHEEAEATVSVFDHGFLFGEGVYEVLRTYDQRPFLFAEHMARLKASAGRIALTCPVTDADMLSRVRDTIASARLDGEAYIRILLTRGVGDIVYDPAACPVPTVVIIVKAHREPPAAAFDEGVQLALVSVMRNHPDSVSPAVKSNNLLNNALAMQEAQARGGFEALMRNHRGELCECAQSNVFLVRDGALFTPPPEAGLLVGITRAFVIDLARQEGLAVHEPALYEADLDTADEAFITSTTREIVPVVAVDDRRIGAGAPGPITRRLMEAFRAAVPAHLS
jgi:branched-chain amino acid aminotransferase